MRILILFYFILFSMVADSQKLSELEIFVAYGNKAPSSHNTKMWKTTLDENRKSIFISVDSAKIIPKVDPNNREAWISIGAFCQNVEYIAQDFDYKTSILMDNDTISLNFEKELNTTQKYAPLIEKRHTLRKPFKNQSIDDIIEPLLLNEQNLVYIKNSDELFKYLVSQSQKANIQQINNFEKRQELAECISLKKYESSSKMELKNLGLNYFERLLFKNFVKEKGFTNSEFIRKKYISQTNDLYDKCAGYILVLSDKNNNSEWFHSGMLLEKVWLFLTENEISVQPMSQIIEEEPYYTQFKGKLDLDKEVQMVLRVGIK